MSSISSAPAAAAASSGRQQSPNRSNSTGASSRGQRSGQNSPQRAPSGDPRSKAAEPAQFVGRAKSPTAPPRVPIGPLNAGQPLDEVLEIIRKGSNEKAQPLVLAVLHMQDFHKKHTSKTLANCTELLDGLLWNVVRLRVMMLRRTSITSLRSLASARLVTRLCFSFVSTSSLRCRTLRTPG